MDQRGTTELPDGTVTFVFTDIEGSTRMASELGDERWAELLSDHQRLLRQAFEAYGGVEVKADGDALFVAFARVSDAVAAAVAAQRGLEGHAWPDGHQVRVRVGLHTGEALVRDGDYVGHHVHQASRVCDAGHGGQILMSQTSADLVGDGLPDDVVLADLGPHRLKDLGGPQHLFAVHGSGLRSDSPPLRTLSAHPNNLPVQLTSFVGREHDLVELQKLLDDARLVTLTGPGGSGKTRLAVQVGAEASDRFGDGVFFVDLAPISDPTLTWPTVARGLGLQLGGSARTVREEVLDHLGPREVLVVVDNCEHLLDASAESVEAILAHCPKVTVLATSREALGVEGERAWPVPPLPLDDEDGGSAVLRLFHDRAAAARPDFRPTAADSEAIREICRSLDGIPLAIELAAARVTHLAPREIVHRLDDRLRLLAGARRRTQRQQTLEAALDWSHELLDPPQQGLFRRLAVFAGGCTLEAIEAVCADDAVPAGDVVHLLGSLVAKSLVVAEYTGSATRYRLLETVRIYAQEKLVASGEVHRLRTAHRDHFLRWVEARPLEDLWFNFEMGVHLAEELDNLRAALRHADEDARQDLVARLIAPVAPRWVWDGLHDEAEAWLSRALETPERFDRDLQVACWCARAEVSLAKLDGRMEEHAGRAVDAASGTRSGPATLALAYQAFAWSIASAVGDPEATEPAERLIGQALGAGPPGSQPPWSNAVHWVAGSHQVMHGAPDRAADHYRAALGTDPRRERNASWAAGGLTAALILLGDPEGALAQAESAGLLEDPWAHEPAILLPWGNIRVAQVMLPATKAHALAACGRTAEARQTLRAVPANTSLLSVPLVVNDWLVACAAVAWHEGDPARASLLLGRPSVEGLRRPDGFALCRHYVALVRGGLDRETAVRCRDEGRAMSPEALIDHALEGLNPPQ